VLVIMNAIYRFTQRISHAGSFFAFVRDSLGVRAGFVTGWLFLAFYPVFVGLDLILFGATLNSIIVAHGGPSIPWWLLMLIGLVVIWGSNASPRPRGRPTWRSGSRSAGWPPGYWS
jgi:GABA permease